MTTKLRFESRGKLMIAGEYLVLAGAKALAIPVRFGQSLSIEAFRYGQPTIDWETYIKGNLWLKTRFVGSNLDAHLAKEEDNRHIYWLREILMAARKLNPEFLKSNFGWGVKAEIDFDINWGLGSSSTLISNIALWANVDQFKLHFMVSEGSAYDIACARSTKPILYTYMGSGANPEVEPISFNPIFSSRLFFVYSGNKQSSEVSIRTFDAKLVSPADVLSITKISEGMARTDSLPDFMKMMVQHESIISKYTGLPPIKQYLFDDFQGEVKSLGAWGGDFFLAASQASPENIVSFFNRKGFDTIFSFEEMVAKNP